MAYKRRRFIKRVPSGPVTEADKALHFDSWSQFVERGTFGPTNMPQGTRASREHGSYLTHTETFEAAADLATNGWVEGTEQAARFCYGLVDKIADRTKRDDFCYDVNGVDFDIARVLDGEPECWFQREPVNVEAAGKVLRVVFSAACSCRISGDVMIKKGAAVAALVMLLERAGYRVAVDIVFAVRGDLKHETWVPLKAADQDLDLARLVFALAHPSSLRRMWFAVAETFSPALRSALWIPGGYGIPDDCAPANQGDIYIPKSHVDEPQWASENTATEWILNRLRGLGVELKQEEVAA